ncbi:MAG TPA: rhodanese-like domain-containing protein [Thermoanaerobaculia bacterium]
MIVLAVGGILVAALVVWALTRQVEPAQPDVAGFSTTSPSTPTASMPPANPMQPIPGTPTQTDSVLPMPTTASPTDDPEAAVRRISAQDLKTKMDAGNVVIVDVRSAEQFQTGHIPGAMNMPFASVEGMMTALPKGKEIVTYCT